MNKKTTHNIIKAKINKWLASITDAQLRGDVKESLIVSGGCIASLLCGEDVNDYDIYIRDMDVLMRLADYYEVSAYDGRLRDKYIVEHKEAIGEDGLEEGDDDYDHLTMLSVFFRTMKPDQVKLMVAGHGEVTKYDAPPEGEELPAFRKLFTSQNAISLSDDIQIVTRFTGTAAEIHKNYDFIHATNYFTMEDGLVCNEAALMSLLTKTLYYQGSLYPLTSIIRMKKFIIRKWRINAGEILKILFQVSQLDLEDIDVLEEQLIGVDVAYFSNLIAVLRTKQKESEGVGGIVEKFLTEEIEKLFN